MSRRIARSVGLAVASGALVALASWNAGALRLDIAGHPIVWVAVAGFGVCRSASERVGPTQVGMAMAVGSLTGAAAGSLVYAPSFAQEAVALGTAAALLSALTLAWSRRFPAGPAAVAFGVGAGGTHLVSFGQAGLVALVTYWTGIALALAAGLAASTALDAIRDARHEAVVGGERPAKPPSASPDTRTVRSP